MKVLDKSKFKTQKGENISHSSLQRTNGKQMSNRNDLQFIFLIAIEHLMTEKRVLRNNSPFLLHLKYSFQTPSQLFLVTDFLGGGDLFFHLAKRQGEGFPLKISRFFTAEMIIALEHLNQAGVVYR